MASLIGKWGRDLHVEEEVEEAEWYSDDERIEPFIGGLVGGNGSLVVKICRWDLGDERWFRDGGTVSQSRGDFVILLGERRQRGTLDVG